MHKMPPECEIVKELDYHKCYACKEKCDYGKRDIANFERHQNDKWYCAMRQEWYSDMRAEIKKVKNE